jgi:putative addiction module component (TIGR02574 family)
VKDVFPVGVAAWNHDSKEPLMNAPFPEFSALSLPERIQLLGDLWDSIAAEPDKLPVDDAQIAELDKRRERLVEHPDSGLTWAQVKQSILSRK